MTKPYDDPEQVAKARWRGGEKHSYADMAEELGCSVGTVSIRMADFSEELKQYGASDFEDLAVDVEREHASKPEWPLEFDLPSGLPTHLEDGTSLSIVVDAAKQNNWFEKLLLHDYLMENHDLTLAEITKQDIELCPNCDFPTIMYYNDGTKKCGQCNTKF